MDHFHIWYCALALAVYTSQDSVASASNGEQQEISFGLIVGDKGSNRARTGVEDAVDQINNEHGLLLGYRLKLTPFSVGSEVICSLLPASTTLS